MFGGRNQDHGNDRGKVRNREFLKQDTVIGKRLMNSPTLEIKTTV